MKTSPVLAQSLVLLAVLYGSGAYAEALPTPSPSSAAPAAATPAKTPATKPESTPAATPVTTAPATTPATAPLATPAATPTPTQPMNCNYHVQPGDTLDNNLILAWAEKAALQLFDMEFSQIDNQVSALKPCFTDQGWSGFGDALEKSGNVETIKSQELHVSAVIEGTPDVMPVEGNSNQWKVNLPMQIVYQNDKEKLTQSLLVELLIGKKSNGDPGIMQIIAAPRDTGANTQDGKAPAAEQGGTP